MDHLTIAQHRDNWTVSSASSQGITRGELPEQDELLVHEAQDDRAAALLYRLALLRNGGCL